jgi:hypothetical protein
MQHSCPQQEIEKKKISHP